jgi:hypothetical protein
MIYSPVFRHICTSVRKEQLGSHCTDFHKISHFRILQKSVQKIPSFVKEQLTISR